MKDYKILFSKTNSLIQSASKILLITHYNPDGDGLSSVCAMAEYLQALKKNYILYCYTEPPATYDFLPQLKDFLYTESLNKQVKSESPIKFSDFDLIMVFDCGSLSRTKLETELTNRHSNQIIIEFDHHPKIDNYADIEIRKTDAAATAEVVYDFFISNKIKLSKSMANTLMTGLVTDTANFLYSSASGHTIEAAANLVRLGAQLPKINDFTMRNKSIEAMKLWGQIMADLQINKKYNFAFSVLPKKYFEEKMIEKEEIEGISGFLSNLHGVNGIMFIRDEGDGIIRGSLRTSQKDIDVSILAKLLGGGGHAKASGFSLKGELVKINERWKII